MKQFNRIRDEYQSNNIISAYESEMTDLKINLNTINFKNVDKNKDVLLKIDFKNYTDEDFFQINRIIDLAKQENINLDILITDNNLKFTINELNEFKKIEEKLQKNSLSFLAFSVGSDDYYSLKSILDAKIVANEFSERLVKSNLSPFEKFLTIYDFVSSRVYLENNSDKGKARYIVPVLNGNEIVCVGYAALIKYFCKFAGISVLDQTCFVYDDKTGGGHANNIVYLKDDKYSIDGLYYADACWDSLREKKFDTKGLNYCLIPLLDTNKLKKVKLDFFGLENFYKENKNEFDYFFKVQLNLKEIDFLKDIITRKKLKNKLLSDSELNIITEKIFNEKNKNEAITKLENFFKSINLNPLKYAYNKPFGADYNDYIPYFYYPENLLSIFMMNEENETFIENIKKGLINETNKIIKPSKKNIYKELEKLKNHANIEECEEFWNKVKISFKSYLQEKASFAVISEIQSKTKPISLENFKKALKVAYKINFVKEKDLDFYVSNIINKSVRKSEKIFAKNATNCFYTEAKKRRKEEVVK